MTSNMVIDFSRLDWLQSVGVASKSLIYLDQRFWIGMVDKIDAVHRDLQREIEKLIEADKVICPINIPHFFELSRQVSQPKRVAVFQLMEQFSKHLALRRIDHVFADEYKIVLRTRAQGSDEFAFPRRTAFSHFAESFGMASIQFPNTKWTGKKAQAVAKWLFKSVCAMPLYSYLENLPKTSLKAVSTYADKLRTSAEKVYSNYPATGKTLDELRDLELAGFVNTFVEQVMLASVTTFGPEETAKRMASGWFGSVNVPENLMNSPFCYNWVMLHAATRHSRQNVRPNDLLDIHHLACALNYCDLIATDGFMRHLARDVLRLDTKYSTRITSDSEELLNWVKELPR